jgi:hypothetical protein
VSHELAEAEDARPEIGELERRIKKQSLQKTIDVALEEPVEALNQPSELQGRDLRGDACSALAG